MSKLRMLLVGTGGWASVHAQASADCRNVELAGICGHRNEERLAKLAAEHGVEATGLDLAALLDEVKPDVLDVACNPHYRLEPVQLAVQCPSVKLINLEKPLALMPGEAYEIAELCRRNGKLLTVNHQKKFLPAWCKLREKIADGSLGEISFMRATCQGNLLEQGTHLVDMLMFYNDYKAIDWIMGQVGDLEGFDKPQASAPDSAVAVLNFTNGVRALVTMGNVGREIPGEANKWQRFAVQVHGDAGHAMVTLNRELTFVDYQSGRCESEPSSWDREFVGAQTTHLDSLADYMARPEQGHISDLDKSLLSFDAVMGIYASASEGGRIEFPRCFANQVMEDLQGRPR